MKRYKICAWFSSRMEQMSGKERLPATWDICPCLLVNPLAVPQSMQMSKPSTEQDSAAVELVLHTWGLTVLALKCFRKVAQ